jgi:excisionase family DNA binding protein
MRKVHKELKKKEESKKHLPRPSVTKEIFNNEISQKKTYSPQEVAPILGVSVNTVRRALDQKVIDHIKTPGGHRRLSDLQIQALKAIISKRRKSDELERQELEI